VRKDLDDQLRILQEDIYLRVERLLVGRTVEKGLRGVSAGSTLTSDILKGLKREQWFEIRTSEDAVFERVVKATELARDRDGAELVIPGCTLFGSLLSHRRQAFAALGVPSVDGMTAGFKLAEMRAELNRMGAIPAVSRAGYFMHPPKTDFQTLRKFDGKPDYLYGPEGRR
jgi:hypothetical protein